MQAGNIDRSKEFKNNSYQRARHTDAEPMNLWEISQLIGSVWLERKDI